MKKSDLFLLREGIARDMGNIYNQFNAFIKNWDQKNDRLVMKVYELNRKVQKLKKKK